jgi:serine/threonine protein kinase
VRREISTLWYRAPELVMGATCYCPKIDEWSVGCIMLEMLVGLCVFPGNAKRVCDCNKASHINYNEDQLSKIFKLLGTPTDKKFLAKMECTEHFDKWPVHPSRLQRTILNLTTAERCANAGDKPNHQPKVPTSLSQICGKTSIFLPPASPRQLDLPLHPTVASLPPLTTPQDVAKALFDSVSSLLSINPTQRASARDAINVLVQQETTLAQLALAHKEQQPAAGSPSCALSTAPLSPGAAPPKDSLSKVAPVIDSNTPPLPTAPPRCK